MSRSLLIQLITLLILLVPTQGFAWQALMESFTETRTQSPNWTFIGDAHLTSQREDPVNQGWLRLTDAQSNRRGVAYLNEAFPSSEGVVISFEYATWGGIGADGMTAFLFDGNIGEPGQEDFRIGGWGGSLGYAQRCSAPGLRGGYIGVGIDEFGNFGNQHECRSGGKFEGLVPDAISIRGPAQAPEPYPFLTGTGTLPWDIDCPRAICSARPQAGEQGYRRIMILILPMQGTYNVSVWSQKDIFSPMKELIQPYTIPQQPPATLKFGYSGSTGNSHNVHELRQLHIAPPVDIKTTIAIDQPKWHRGQEVTYTIEVTNGDYITAQDVAIQHQSPLEDVSWLCTKGCEASGEASINLSLDLERNAHITIEVQGTVPDDAGKLIDMLANATPNDQTIDIQPDNNAFSTQQATDGDPPVVYEPPPTYTVAEPQEFYIPMLPTPPTTEPIEPPVVIAPQNQPQQEEVILIVDPEVDRYEGTGCQSAPGSPPVPVIWLAILPLIALARRRTTLVLLLLLPSTALAQTPASSTNIRLEAYEPQPASREAVLQTHGILPQHNRLSIETGAMIHYAHRPLILRQGDRTVDVIANQYRAELGLAASWRGLGLDITVPFLVQQQGEDRARNGTAQTMDDRGLSDIRLTATYTLLQQGPLSGGFSLIGHAPTGTTGTLNAGGQWAATAMGKAQWQWQNRCRTLANLGYNWRQQQTARNLVIGPFVRTSVATACPIPSTALSMEASAFIDLPTQEDNPTRQEVFAALRWDNSWMRATAMLGKGIGTTPGTPSWRTGLQAQFQLPSQLTQPKADASCPWPVEDYDGFEDDDGCLDPDNDNDGVPDVDDLCPNVAGPKQGCPHKDTDGDRIPDTLDACPKHPAPNTQDGCPTTDRDKDGILDHLDACPTQPEDLDHYKDDDGCPDPDNDNDGILDAQDKCPNHPETFNKLADDDGCPDRVTVTQKGQNLYLQGRIFFKHNLATIEPQSHSILRELAKHLAAHPEIQKLDIIGHANALGTDQRNAKLSQRRAHAVMMFLISCGISPTRLNARAMGSSLPWHNNQTALGRALNRRVEFKVVKTLQAEDRTP